MELKQRLLRALDVSFYNCLKGYLSSGMDSSERFANVLLDVDQQGYTIHNYTSQQYTSDGLHFSSDVQEVKVYMKNEKGELLCVDLLSKRLPNKEKQIVVNSGLGFIKEAAFYNHFIPEYNRILRNHNLDTQNIFPKCYFTSENEILLEDLRKFKFITSKDSLNKNQTVLVLQEIAKFHSTGVALKLTNPDLFKTKLAVVATPALQNENNPKKENLDKGFRTEINELVNSMKGFEQFADSVDLLLRKIDQTKLPIPSEPYATLLHNDLWNGNILFKYSIKNKPIEVKLVDFQTTIYNSPARDLVYFLFTSVNMETLKEFMDLLSFYHRTFVHNLSKLGVNDLQQFSYELFMDEIDIYGPSKLKHILKLFKTRSSIGVQETNFEFQLQRIIQLFHERKWI